MNADLEIDFPKLLTVRQTAKLLNVTTRTVYLMIENLQIPCTVLGPKSYRIKESDLQKLVS